jgi:hypothetical protein
MNNLKDFICDLSKQHLLNDTKIITCGKRACSKCLQEYNITIDEKIRVWLAHAPRGLFGEYQRNFLSYENIANCPFCNSNLKCYKFDNRKTRSELKVDQDIMDNYVSIHKELVENFKNKLAAVEGLKF